MMGWVFLDILSAYIDMRAKTNENYIFILLPLPVRNLGLVPECGLVNDIKDTMTLSLCSSLNNITENLSRFKIILPFWKERYSVILFLEIDCSHTSFFHKRSEFPQQYIITLDTWRIGIKKRDMKRSLLFFNTFQKSRIIDINLHFLKVLTSKTNMEMSMK